jgi:hypothetical protein
MLVSHSAFLIAICFHEIGFDPEFAQFEDVSSCCNEG